MGKHEKRFKIEALGFMLTPHSAMPNASILGLFSVPTTRNNARRHMKEILLVTKDEVLVRKLWRDKDEFNLFPIGRYEQHKATPEDIKRISPQLWEELCRSSE